MTALDYILDGLEAELALERELGIRSIEIDRSLLIDLPRAEASAAPRRVVAESAARPAEAASVAAPLPRVESAPRAQERSSDSVAIVFLHDKPLTAAGEEMMSKIIAALKLPTGAAKVVVAPPMPKAKVHVVLGGLALKKWFPEQQGAPGQWLTTESGQEVLVTYSPAYILRFGTVTPAVKKIKLDMWTAIKSVLRKI